MAGSETPGQIMKYSQRLLSPPPERGQWRDLRGHHRYGQEQDHGIAQEDYHRGKQVALIADVRLAAFENMPGERDMKPVAGTQYQVKPGDIRLPIPCPISGQKN